MQPINYFALIHRYIPPDSPVYQVYLPHVSLVTAKALRIAQRLGLSREQQRFIEEAAMLHDIGIVHVQRYSTALDETRPYICHAPQGRIILERESLPRHALVAERHVGVGISEADIREQQLPLPLRDYCPHTLEERIISWADLFFSKTPEKLWREAPIEQVRAKVARRGPRHVAVFEEWLALFGG
jgi:uncharacterized protein